MTEVLRAAIGIFATLAPLGLVLALVALPVDADRAGKFGGRGRMIGLAALATGVTLLLAVALTDPFLDLLGVVPESFQAGAAVIMLPLAAQLLWTGRSVNPGEKVTSRPWLMPLTYPGMAGPASIAAVIAYAARFGEAEAAAAVVLAVTLAAGVLAAGRAIERAAGKLALGFAGRLSGAFIVVIALELAVDGVRSV